MELLQSVERYLAATEMSASKFGRKVARDPRLVFDLRRGREVKSRQLRSAIARQLAGPR